MTDGKKQKNEKKNKRGDNMPTGYTIDLYEGKEVTFEEFVMKCARAFGALISVNYPPLKRRACR